MMRYCVRIEYLIVATVVLLGLSACRQSEQSAPATAGKLDTPPWQSTDNGFFAPGYEAGDKTRWQMQLRQRSQNQNESNKMK